MTFEASPRIEARGWTSPDDRFSVTFPHGWSAFAILGSPPPVLIHFGDTDRLDEGVMCFVLRVSAPSFDGADQDAVNAAVSDWDDLQITRNTSSGAFVGRVLTWSSDDVDGVQVASAVIEARPSPTDGAMQLHTRQFLLSDGAQAWFHSVNCGVRDPEINGVDAETLLASLRFSD